MTEEMNYDIRQFYVGKITGLLLKIRKNFKNRFMTLHPEQSRVIIESDIRLLRRFIAMAQEAGRTDAIDYARTLLGLENGLERDYVS